MDIMVHSYWNFSFEIYVGGLCDYVSTKQIGLAGAPAENEQVLDNLPYALLCWVWAGPMLLLLCSTIR
jgi:hypothetical protein